MRRGLSAAVTVLSLLALATGCGEDTAGGEPGTTTGSSAGPSTDSATSSPAEGGTTSEGSTEPDVQTIEVTIADGEVTPAGDRIDVGVDEPVDIVITSDVAGELHVHSSPETYEDFTEGTNDPIKLQFDRPGLVDIELHEPFEGPVVQLQVQ